MPFGCRTDRTVRFQSHLRQRLSFNPDEDEVHLSADKGVWEQWALVDAGDGKFFITNKLGQHLSDNDGTIGLSADMDHKEKWTISDGSLGQAFLKSHRGMFLQDAGGRLGFSRDADGWEKWWIHDIEGYPGCRFESANLFCFLVMRSWGHELEMVKNMHEKKASVFACDSSMVFSDATIQLGKWAWSTHMISNVLQHDNGAFEDHHLFEQIWAYVWHDRRYRLADWVVKTDPAAVFIPDRLRARLGGRSHAKTHDSFYATCGDDENAYMYGPLGFSLRRQWRRTTMAGGTSAGTT